MNRKARRLMAGHLRSSFSREGDTSFSEICCSWKSWDSIRESKSFSASDKNLSYNTFHRGRCLFRNKKLVPRKRVTRKIPGCYSEKIYFDEWGNRRSATYHVIARRMTITSAELQLQNDRNDELKQAKSDVWAIWKLNNREISGNICELNELTLEDDFHDRCCRNSVALTGRSASRSTSLWMINPRVSQGHLWRPSRVALARSAGDRLSVRTWSLFNETHFSLWSASNTSPDPENRTRIGEWRTIVYRSFLSLNLTSSGKWRTVESLWSSPMRTECQSFRNGSGCWSSWYLVWQEYLKRRDEMMIWWSDDLMIWWSDDLIGSADAQRGKVHLRWRRSEEGHASGTILYQVEDWLR
jgi:hypothetical protein